VSPGRPIRRVYIRNASSHPPVEAGECALLNPGNLMPATCLHRPRGRPSLLAAASLVLLLSACGSSDGPPTQPPSEVSVASVRVTPDSTDVPYRGTRDLSAATLSASGTALTGRTVTWLSSNETIASVSAAGVVTAHLPGVVTITASSEGQQGTARIRVVAADLTSIVDSLRQAFAVPALGAAIVTRDGGMVARGAAGVRRWGTTTPVTVNDKWHLGSNAKAVTALLAAVTVKEGRLGWDDRMTARYPELGPIARPEFAGTTLRDLATMRSGIIGNPGFTPTGTAAQQRAAVDTWAVRQPPAAPPGTYYYSNVSYQILAEIVGRAWGNGYEQALRDRLWTPLGVTTAGLGPTTGPGQSDQPNGHSPAPGGWVVCEACDNSWAAGSGMIHMSLADWARVVRELMRADAGQSTLLTQAEARILTSAVTPINSNQAYGYGWIVFTNAAQRTGAHDGSNVRNRSRATLYLDTGVAFLLTTNAGDSAANGGVPNAALNALHNRLQTYWQTGR
jgi:CubicO group peptidase (beta-lactamase class C family)